MADVDVVTVQLGRVPRSSVDVVARCHLGLPVVIAVPPHLDDGTPFPTRFWLTCPLALRRIGRVESAGGVGAAQRRVASDQEYRAAYESAMRQYAEERDASIAADAPRHRPGGGVGGSAAGVKCLHAHYAHHAAGGDNPVGAETAVAIEPLDCTRPCVAVIEGRLDRNPEWREPRR